MSNYELRHVAEQETEENNGQSSSQQTDDQLPEVVVVGSRDGRLLLDSDRQPIDKYKLVLFILILHGAGTLMPWNMFINAQAYFRDYKLTPSNNTGTMDIDTDELSKMKKNFLPYVSLASQLPNVLFAAVNLLVNMGSGNLQLRVNSALAIEAIIFLITIILAVVDSSKWPVTFFYVTMISVVIMNVASGIYQNCIFGTGAKFPDKYTNAILIGSNLSGTFTSIVNLLSIWLAPDPRDAAMYYFTTALIVIILCIISYNLLPLNPFFQHYENKSNQKTKLEIVTYVTDNSNDNTLIANDVPESLRRTVDAMVPKPEASSILCSLRRIYQGFKQCWPQCLNVFLTFFITLALFPSVMADIQRSQDYISEKYFSSIACFFLFNVFAMIGNLISGLTTWPGRDRVWLMVVSRFIFIPFFLFCKFHPESRRWPILITNDIVYMIGNILFALSSGYLSSLCMMFASNNLKPEDAHIGGMLAAFFLVFGIFVGINSSFLLTFIVELGHHSMG